MSIRFSLRSRSFFKLTDEKRGWAFISPMIIFMMVLYLYPLLQSSIISFKDRSGNWSGLSNYLQLFSDSMFWLSLKNTVIFTIVSVVLHLIVGLGIALLLNLKLRPLVMNFFRGILMIPWLLATVVAAGIWVLIYHPVGILNYFFTSLHIISVPISWLGNPKFALLSVILVNVWKFYPIFMVMILAGLKAIPIEIYEAAKVDGVKPYQSFLHITLPHLRSIIIFVTLLDTIWTFRHFDLVYVMTGGGPMYKTELLTNYIYDVSFRNLQFNYGSTIAIFMLIISLIFSVFYLRLYHEGE